MASCASMRGRRRSCGRPKAGPASGPRSSPAIRPSPRSAISSFAGEEFASLSDSELRLDKWLWHARFCRTRNMAATLAEAGKVRIAGSPIFKAHYAVKPGDVLTFPLGPHIRTVKVLALGIRRGPPAAARLLYEDLAPPPPYS